jgi:hypothetical protein
VLVPHNLENILITSLLKEWGNGAALLESA